MQIEDLYAAREKVPPHCVLHDPLRVMKNQCATCPWRGSANGGLPLDSDVMNILQTEPNVGNQYCHSPAWNGKPEEYICRGHRNHWQKICYALGEIEAPTDEAWEKRFREIND